jgi:hypothetical protein
VGGAATVDARRTAAENAARLGEVRDATAQMAGGAVDFAEMARQIRRAQE